MSRFADVILPLSLHKYYTYRIPAEWQDSLVVGSRVVVSFGRTRYYTAIVVRVHDDEPIEYDTKEISTLLDTAPLLHDNQLRFWEWIADYYLCAVGDVFKAAVPSGLKLESETQITINRDFIEKSDTPLREREIVLLSALETREKMSVQELERASGLRNILQVVRSLLEREAVIVSEEMRQRYRPHTECYVRLCGVTSGEQESLQSIFEQLKAAKKQIRLLMCYLEMSGFMRQSNPIAVSRRDLLERADVSPAVFAAMVQRGVFEVYTVEISRLSESVCHVEPMHRLSSAQQEAYEGIIESFKNRSVTLLHGVTSSGKTEVYIHLIDQMLKQGRQVLYLVPEIALTTQLTSRLQRVFGDKLSIYHSKFTDNERVEIWNCLLRETSGRVVLGVRSAVFLPFSDLGLVIVDEEHEGSYKQQEPAPRYHARNAAIVLASMYGAKTLLGTATPSIETYYNAQTGKYGHVELASRYADIALPEIVTVDVGDMRRKRRMTWNSNISPQLMALCTDALQRGEQVILFQNRRGFAPMVECRFCAWTPRCEHCDVSLTYHKQSNRLVCHYCGYTRSVPQECPSCKERGVEVRGFGTERIEEEVERAFPDYTVARMDLDTTRNRKAYEQIISDFEQQKSRILIGTQMVTKGLDFDKVSVVGILSADALLNYPDFRSHERAFLMMEQVAGRAGRKGRRGVVVLQTAQPTHAIVNQLQTHDYASMYATQIAERRAFGYPPYTRLIYIYLKYRDEVLLQVAAEEYVRILVGKFGSRVSGVHTPLVSRVQSLYIRRIMLKIEQTASVGKVRQILRTVQELVVADARFKSLIVYYDVDPM